MAKRTSIKAAGSPIQMEKKTEDVVMTNGNEEAGDVVKGKGKGKISKESEKDEVGFFSTTAVDYDNLVENS